MVFSDSFPVRAFPLIQGVSPHKNLQLPVIMKVKEALSIRFNYELAKGSRISVLDFHNHMLVHVGSDLPKIRSEKRNYWISNSSLFDNANQLLCDSPR